MLGPHQDHRGSILATLMIVPVCCTYGLTREGKFTVWLFLGQVEAEAELHQVEILQVY